MSAMPIEASDRTALIRKGNEFFNEGKFEDAAKIFRAVGYKDGLSRIGDHYFYKMRRPLNALPYYQAAGFQERIDDIKRRFFSAFMKVYEKEVKGAPREDANTKETI